MAKRDYYEILGISKSATADEIKRAYQSTNAGVVINVKAWYYSFTAPRYGSPSRGSFIGAMH